MLFMPALAPQAGFNWVGLIVTVVVVAIIWVIIRTILKITLKLFAMGCLGLLILSGIAFVVLNYK
jgi:hypothetical protein